MDKPLVSIISINYKQASVTCEMLASLRQITYPNYEVIVVDNASPEAEIQPIADQFPEVHLIRSPENLGFAGGNNLGIAVAKGKYLLFLNNDTEVDPGFLEPLVELFEANPKAGIASPKIIFHGTDNLIQYAGCGGINPWTGRSVTFGLMEKDEGQHNVSSPTPLIHGAAMMVPMEVIRKVGLMPELYFLYYEELDWCEMIKRGGYESHYVAQGTVYHKESVSVGQGSVMRTYYMYRNRLLYIRRNSSGVRFWSGMLFFLFVAVPKQGLVYGLHLEQKYLDALWRGLKWHLHPHNVHQNHFLS
ncbi:glycosyltransferase family 2 protein [Hymenobacter sp. BT186]|uniref:Glycosyltransferase family 2 protein n=1 Tax=Hymenobacter telluris TaxID=2816474 RepID=A0A939ETR9_9BACT|nr:glycosyltransferase family 2 protein [Hymenobacter telluris]MBO0356811.1 glycosyltransferase family 2 protein [Hymenobacter telluris]MBW3372837.1 glycosyltransferase family 2 protein [Hymenobacter norwichensis]